LVKTLLSILKDLGHLEAAKKLIPFVKDRPGHDWWYAIDGSKSERELGWQPQETIGTGLRRSVEWYLKNGDWMRYVQDDGHKEGFGQITKNVRRRLHSLTRRTIPNTSFDATSDFLSCRQ
jgi:dTDP-D-glucose 4,6-dehydratase